MLTITELGDDTISICGEVDAETAPRLMAAAALLGPEIRIECGGCVFIDSRGVSALLAISERTQLAGGKVVLVDPSRAVNRLLGLCGLIGSDAFVIEGIGERDDAT